METAPLGAVSHFCVYLTALSAVLCTQKAEARKSAAETGRGTSRLVVLIGIRGPVGRGRPRNATV